jgi:sarcosine oxidase
VQSAYQTVVLGLGAMGSAALYQLARKGNKVLGIDQYHPPHNFGSTHGVTRITRQAIGEGNEYVPFALRSHELWREMEKETGRNLLTITGGLIITSNETTGGMHGTDLYLNTIKAAKKFNIRHELFDAAQLRKRFPQFKITDDTIAYYEEGAGFLRHEECVETELMLAEREGATIHYDEKVIAFAEKNNLIKIKTERAEYEAEQLIITAGPWLPEIFTDVRKNIFSVTRQVMYWFQPDNNDYDFSIGKFPVFIWQVKDKTGFYGFPLSYNNNWCEDGNRTIF